VTGKSCCTAAGLCTNASQPRCGFNGGTIVAADPCSVVGSKCPPGSGACCVLELLPDVYRCEEPYTQQQCEVAGAPGNRYRGDGTTCGDEDHDGVEDCNDYCPNTPPGEPAQTIPPARGCSCTQNALVCFSTSACERLVCDPRSPRADARGCVRTRIPGCCETDADCDDHDACTRDVCINRACGHITISCDDDGIACTVDRCNKVLGCNYPVHERCNDGDRCTVDSCIAGIGCLNVPVLCADFFACTRDSCDPNTGACLYTPDHTRCNDNDPCTADECDPSAPDFDARGCTHRRPGQRGLVCGDGDVNGDGVTDSNDVSGFGACLNAGGPGSTAAAGCAPGDMDGDGDVDLADVGFVFNDPFRCNDQVCETAVGGKCVGCPEGQVCAPDGGFAIGANDPVIPRDDGGHAGIEEAVATGGTSDCKTVCRSELGCFPVSKCETCVIPGGQSSGVCRDRCDASRCEKCDGQGHCNSRCLTNERCVNGVCVGACESDSDCFAGACQVCREGLCVFGCTAGQVCVFVSFSRGVCSSTCNQLSDCPPCHVCALDLSGFFAGCVPCDAVGGICRGDICLAPCEDGTDCDDCERCEAGACVNDCPPGTVCNAFGECRNTCTSNAQCGPCETCFSYSGVGESFCATCPDDLFCFRCEGEACVPKCSASACELCSQRDGGCGSRCGPNEVCDGAGQCVPH
jgi:hypothetical protein